MPYAKKSVVATPEASCGARSLAWVAGYIVYHGPRERVVDFFAQQGFACPARKGVADFLQEVTSSKDQEVCRRLRANNSAQM